MGANDVRETVVLNMEVQEKKKLSIPQTAKKKGQSERESDRKEEDTYIKLYIMRCIILIMIIIKPSVTTVNVRIEVWADVSKEIPRNTI